MITVVREPTLPWRSLDARNELYINIEFPIPTDEEVECCMDCQKKVCNNCKGRKPRCSTGKKRGRPRKDANITITGQITISM